jgi:hypothetical protein
LPNGRKIDPEEDIEKQIAKIYLKKFNKENIVWNDPDVWQDIQNFH